MMTPIQEFDQMCNKLGIPKDRTNLVKRNLELRGKLNGVIKAFTMTVEVLHESFSHPEEFSVCTSELCSSFRKTIELSKPE